MNDPKEEVKHRLDIREVIGQYIKLQKAGTNYKAVCPFHSEKTPSFMVSPDKQMWHCFGCGEGGDLFTFIEKIEGVDFREALRMMAEKAGVELRSGDKERSSERKKLLDIIELATKFYEKQLESKTGKEVQKYLQSRGAEARTIHEWRLGYAPDRWDGLYDFLASRGFSDELVERAGLTIESSKKTKGRTHHDRFRHRVMFPIFDVQGHPVGFSGRLFEEVKGETAGKNAGKYINTPATPLYDKSRVLYGLDRAKMPIKKEGRCVVVEGNLDVVLAHQAGTTEAVAPCGTAVGSDHLDIIKRYTDTVAFCFDSDSAGVKATKKGARTALTKGLNVSVIELPQGKDAADVIADSKDEWQKRAKSPVSLISFVMHAAKESADMRSARGKKEFVKEVLGTIQAVASPIEQEHWLGELAAEAGVSEKALRDELEALPKDEDTYEPQRVQEEEGEQKGGLNVRPLTAHAVEEYLVALAIKHPEGLSRHSDILELLENERVRAIVENLSKGVSIEELSQKDDTIGSFVFAAELLDEIMPTESIPEEFDRVVQYVRTRSLKKRLKKIEQDLKKAERKEDTEKVQALMAKFNDLSQKLIKRSE